MLWAVEYDDEGEWVSMTMKFENGYNSGNLGFHDSLAGEQPYHQPYVLDENGYVKVTEDENYYQYYNVVSVEGGIISTLQDESLATVADNGVNQVDQWFFTTRSAAEEFLAAKTAAAKEQFSISATPVPTSGGKVYGAGAYEKGASFTLEAVPANGYTFKEWTSGTLRLTTNPLTLTADKPYAITAVFEVIYDSPRIAGSIELVGGWWNSSWFGNFFESRSGWIYHEVQGWFFPVESGIDSYWLWDEFLGWLWTSKEAVPYFYDHDDSKWLQLGNLSSGTRVAYDFENKKWSILPRTTPKSTSTGGTQTNSGQTGTGSNSQPIAGTDFASTKTALANASGLAEAINLVKMSTGISEESKYKILVELSFFGVSEELTRLGASLGY
jgi:hypothetical protein